MSLSKLWSPGILMVMVLASGCDNNSSGDVFGSLTIPECEDGETRALTCAEGVSDCRAFDLDPDFFTMDVTGDQAFIRIQKGSYYPPDVDGLFIQIRDTDALVIGDNAIGMEENVRVGLHLGDTCPGGRHSLAFSGTLALQSFGTGSGDRVQGSISPLQVSDGRSGEALGQLTVRFDFEYALGSPHQPFSRR
ncbi:MAG: hypothetical protein ACE366_27815 [Bradymonadia bacterium]